MTTGALTPEELARLTAWKTRYHAEARGWSRPEAQRLTFVRLLYLAGRLREWPAERGERP